MLNHLIQTIPILSPDELESINREIDLRKESFAQSAVFREDNQLKHSEGRTSLDLRLEENDPLCQVLHKAIDEGLYKYTCALMEVHEIFTHWPMPCDEKTSVVRDPIQILRYPAGKRYVFHHDVNDYASAQEYHRTFSTVLYLNGSFEGGGTEFIGEVFKPRPGEALYFPSNWCFPHAGQEVTSGEKRVAVTWWYSFMGA